MLAGKIVGSIVSTRKCDKLAGNKLMVVEFASYMKTDSTRLIAIDLVGAGSGEYVLVATGSAARIGCGVLDAPVDAAIVGIIDDGTGLE